jgi:hypothetical protein
MYHSSVQTTTTEAYIAPAGARIIDIIDVLAETASRECSAGGAKPQSIQPHATDRRRALFPCRPGLLLPNPRRCPLLKSAIEKLPSSLLPQLIEIGLLNNWG